jgi:hypothetical protein
MSCPKENKPDHSHRDNHEGQTPDQNITDGRAALGSASLDRGFYNRRRLWLSARALVVNSGPEGLWLSATCAVCKRRATVSLNEHVDKEIVPTEPIAAILWQGSG